MSNVSTVPATVDVKLIVVSYSPPGEAGGSAGGVLGVKEWAKMAIDYVRTPRFNPLDMTATNRCVMAFNLSFLFNEHELLRECMENIVT